MKYSKKDLLVLPYIYRVPSHVGQTVRLSEDHYGEYYPAWESPDVTGIVTLVDGNELKIRWNISPNNSEGSPVVGYVYCRNLIALD